MEIRILAAADIRRALTARDAVDAMRTAFGELSGGTATVPVRSHLETTRGRMLVMPAVLGNHGALGTKASRHNKIVIIRILCYSQAPWKTY